MSFSIEKKIDSFSFQSFIIKIICRWSRNIRYISKNCRSNNRLKCNNTDRMWSSLRHCSIPTALRNTKAKDTLPLTVKITIFHNFGFKCCPPPSSPCVVLYFSFKLLYVRGLYILYNDLQSSYFFYTVPIARRTITIFKRICKT